MRVDAGITSPKYAVRDRGISHSPLRHSVYQDLRNQHKVLQA